jgi:hypothetical protein
MKKAPRSNPIMASIIQLFNHCGQLILASRIQWGQELVGKI